jgi:integrase
VSRRRREFGSIRPLPSGRHQGRYQHLGRTVSQTFDHDFQAADWLNDARVDIRRDDWVDPRLATRPFQEWAAEWMSSLTRPSDLTRKGYAALLERHAKNLGPIPVNRIRRTDVEDLVRGVLDSRSPGTARNALTVVRRVLNRSVDARAIRRNPAHDVDAPLSRGEEMVFLSHEQVRKLANVIEPPYGIVVLFAAYTGLRAGEIWALRVRNLRMLERRVEVLESLNDAGGALRFQPPKGKAFRSVSMPEFLVERLAEHLSDRPAMPESFVFTAPRGGPVRHRNFYRRTFRPAVADLAARTNASGTPLIPARTRFHDLRHTYATFLIAEGAPAKAIAVAMGHKGITVTMDRYGHLLPSIADNLSKSLDARYRDIESSTEASSAAGPG